MKVAVRDTPFTKTVEVGRKFVPVTVMVAEFAVPSMTLDGLRAIEPAGGLVSPEMSLPCKIYNMPGPAPP
jgi:hypothetical protein